MHHGLSPHSRQSRLRLGSKRPKTAENGPKRRRETVLDGDCISETAVAYPIVVAYPSSNLQIIMKCSSLHYYQLNRKIPQPSATLIVASITRLRFFLSETNPQKTAEKEFHQKNTRWECSVEQCLPKSIRQRNIRWRLLPWKVGWCVIRTHSQKK